MDSSKRAVILHSGGLDSTTLIGQAIADGMEDFLLVSIRYGSQHNAAEGLAAAEVFEWYRQEYPLFGWERVTFELPAEIFHSNRSALMGEIEMPSLTYQEIQQSEGPSPTVVPFRNANLLSIATALADAREYGYVYIGAHGDDAHQWAYPDCTPEFLGAMANAIYIGSYQKVRLAFPFIWMTKGNIVAVAAAFEVPLELTWSCYNPQTLVPPGKKNGTGIETEFVHCGRCPTCIERANAFVEAGFYDPTGYMLPLEEVVGEAIDGLELEEWGDG